MEEMNVVVEEDVSMTTLEKADTSDKQEQCQENAIESSQEERKNAKKKHTFTIVAVITIAALTVVCAIFAFLYFSSGITIEKNMMDTELFDENGLVRAKSGGKWGFIDKNGKFVINPQFDSVSNFVDGLACVVANELYGYIDTTGAYVINPQFDNAEDFYNDLAVVCTGGKYGYIDRTGNYVINPQFDWAGSFFDDVARVEVGEKYGFINKSGAYVINPQFDSVDYFSNGLAAVKSGDRWGYIDITGKVIIGYQFVEAYSMSDDGYAVVVTTDKKYAIIDKEGNYTATAMFEGIDNNDYTFCAENGCYNHSYGDEYCYTHEEDDESSDWSFCDYYNCYNIAYYGDYCSDHNYLE